MLVKRLNRLVSHLRQATGQKDSGSMRYSENQRRMRGHMLYSIVYKVSKAQVYYNLHMELSCLVDRDSDLVVTEMLHC